MHVITVFFRAIIFFFCSILAKAVVRKYRPFIAVVTGGVGKTLTKNAVYTALSQTFFVRRTGKTLHGDLSVPLAVLGISDGHQNIFHWIKNFIESFLLLVMRAPYPQWLVIEANVERPGDIARTLAWLSPTVVVATRFPEVPSHVEFFESPSAVMREESAPVGWLRSGGILAVNADDERALSLSMPEGVHRITFGLDEKADVRVSRLHLSAHAKMPSGISFDVTYQNERAHVSLAGVAGIQHAYSVLAGIAVALSFGVSLESATASFEHYKSLPGRMNLIPGMRDSVLIDDSYNASPTATEEALRTLSEIPHAGRRIAVLADMLELGAFSVQEHCRIGALAATSADMLVTAGVRAHDLARSAREAGMPAENVLECENTAEAVSRLLAVIGTGDVVLIKGSQGMRMERVVKSVMANPERAGELLVRQEREWLK